MILSLFIMATSSFPIIFAQNLVPYYISMAILGYNFSVLHVCFMSLLLEMYKLRYQSIIQLIYTFGGAGIVMSDSLIYQVMMMAKSSSSNPYASMTRFIEEKMEMSPNPSNSVSSSTTRPYSIIGFTFIVPSILLAISHIALFMIQYRKYKNSPNEVQEMQPSSLVYHSNTIGHKQLPKLEIEVTNYEEKGKILWRPILIGSLIMFYSSFIISNLTTHMLKVSTKLMKNNPSFALSLLSSTVSIASLISIFTPFFIKPTRLLFGHLALFAIGIPILFIGGNNSFPLTATGIVLISIGFSSVEPNVIALLHNKNKLSTLALGILLFARSPGSIVSAIISIELLNNNEKYNFATTSALMMLVLVFSVTLVFKLNKIQK